MTSPMAYFDPRLGARVIKGWRKITLVPLVGPDEFVTIKLALGDVRDLEHLGRTFVKTNRRTDGGWSIFRERPQPA